MHIDAIPQVKKNEAYASNIVTERNELYETRSNVASEELLEVFEEDAYWEPASNVNELYRQLSSKKIKCREIVQEEIE